MNWFKAIAMTLGPRLVGAAVSVVVTKAAQHGVTLDPIETMGVFSAVYAAVHKAVSSKVNPGDAAKGRVADAEKEASNNGGTVVVPTSR